MGLLTVGQMRKEILERVDSALLNERVCSIKDLPTTLSDREG